MGNKRVHELAKEFGMTSKELLEHLERLKIPAKNHASTLIEPYVDKIRKELADVIAERQAVMQAQKEAAEEKARKEEEERKKREEEERKRAEEEERKRAEEEERKKREAARAEEERRKREEEERKRAEEEERKKREEEERLRREKEEEERYRKMAREAEEAQRQQRILKEAHAVAEAAQKQGKPKKKAKRKKPEEEPTSSQVVAEETVESPVGEVVRVTEGTTVGEFAEALGIPSTDVIKQLMMMGEMLTVNQVMAPEAMELVAHDLGREVEVVPLEAEAAPVVEDKPEDLEPRPPVVTVMGHVDHGKTSLLDAIRETGVAQTEAGGITQHIGASVVHHNGKQITFIDTPGHEAFTAMRARGANLTDIAVLVVAADDGVMPQTVEAIHHAKAAGVPIVVAVNKIDKPDADPQRVRNELSEHELIPEDWGGDTIFVDVSAKQRTGIDDLLEMLLLVADVEELKANPNAPASGVVIEAKLDKGRGPVATVLVQRGTLRVGDALIAGTSYGRARALVDPFGQPVEEARPADPVEVLGLSSVPSAGDDFMVMEDERAARTLAEERALKQRLVAHERRHVSLDDLFARIQEGEIKDLNIVLKADTQGSVEAIVDALGKLDQSEVRINVIHSGVGGITETDVTLADASDAIIIGFNVRPNPAARKTAEKASVDMRLYTVIYQVVEDINAARVGMLSPEFREEDRAVLEVLETFKVPKVGVVAGCVVTEGEVSVNDRVRVVRDGTIIFDGEVASLRRFKDDVSSVKAGYECGLGVKDFQDIKVGDLIEAYRTVEVAREA
ncbi:MAG: translation initiation factor IF-2 [Coriobacteriia bacterium]